MCSCRQAAAPLQHNQRTLRRYSILVTSLFKEKCIPGKREGHDSLFCIRLINSFWPLGQGENKAWAGLVAAKAPSGILPRSAFPRHQHCKGETQLGNDNVPKSSQTTDFSSRGSLGMSSSRAALCHASPAVPSSLEEHALF